MSVASKIARSGSMVAVANVLILAGCYAPVREALPPSTTIPPPASSSPASRAEYPAHWWAPVTKEGAPAWEILPQEAGPGEVILSKLALKSWSLERVTSVA